MSTYEERRQRVDDFHKEMRRRSGENNPRCICGHVLDIHDRYTTGGDETKKKGPMCYADRCTLNCTEFRLPNRVNASV